MARTLERAGLVVDALASATDVADIADWLKDADALITDVVMPGVTGPDLVDALRRLQCDKPVVYISGYADHEMVERVRRSPHSALVTKPFTAEAITGRLDQLTAEPREPFGAAWPDGDSVDRLRSSQDGSPAARGRSPTECAPSPNESGGNGPGRKGGTAPR